MIAHINYTVWRVISVESQRKFSELTFVVLNWQQPGQTKSPGAGTAQTMIDMRFRFLLSLTSAKEQHENI
jgi:hypothetical protein